MTTTTESQFLSTSRGDRVAYGRYGSGPGVVFVTGAGPDRANDPITEQTAQLVAKAGFTAVTWDRLGRGESAADGVLDLDRELEALAAVMALAGEPTVLVGHSSGCSIALAAADRGMAVTGLVLWEAPIADANGDTAEWAEQFELFLDRGELENAQLWYMKDMPPEWVENAKASGAWPHIFAQAGSMRADAQSMRWATDGDPAGTFAGVRIPVLILAGTETFDEMIASSQLVADAIPGARQERIAGAHHSWEPDAMASRIVEFALGR